VDMITKAERSRLQTALGFHKATVDDRTLQDAWTQQTGQSRQALTPLLQPPKTPQKRADATLKTWLETLQRLRQTPIR